MVNTSEKDLKAVHAFIARDSEFYANQQVAKIIQRIEYVAAMPTLGHRVHEHPELLLREIHAGSYRIVYVFDDNTLQVVTILHMKQQMKPSSLE